MSDSTNEMLQGEREIALPLFLSRAGAQADRRLRPPPLPAVAGNAPRADLFSVLWAGRGAVSLIVCAGVIGLGCVAAAGSRLLWNGPDAAEPKLVEAPRPVRRKFSQAHALVAQVEERLAYATRFSDHLDAADSVQPTSESAASALAAAMAGGWETPPASDPIGLQVREGSTDKDTVALLVLRNLPTNVTLLEGAAAGEGVWAIAAREAGELSNVLGDGFDAPVWTDVEMVSQSGMTLRTARIALQKDAGTPPSASKAVGGASVLATGSISSEAPVQATAAREASADASASDGEAQAKPAKSRRHARLRRNSTSAVASEERKTRNGVSLADAWSSKTTREAQRSQVAPSRAMAVGAAKAEQDGEKPGLIAKFVTWLKGNQTAAADAQTSETTGAVAAPASTSRAKIDTDSSFSQFGMFQEE